MRDVKEASEQSGVKSIAKYIFQFLRHPIYEIARLPNWSWKTLIWVQILSALISGLLAGLTKPNIFNILAGIILTPIAAMLMVSVLTAFLYYYFQVFEKRSVPVLKIFTLTVFSSIPFFILQIGSSIVPLITLIGFAFSTMLIAVGLTENFQMEKRRAIRLSLVLFAVVFLVWVTNKISSAKLDRSATYHSATAFSE